MRLSEEVSFAQEPARLLQEACDVQIDMATSRPLQSLSTTRTETCTRPWSSTLVELIAGWAREFSFFERRLCLWDIDVVKFTCILDLLPQIQPRSASGSCHSGSVRRTQLSPMRRGGERCSSSRCVGHPPSWPQSGRCDDCNERPGSVSCAFVHVCSTPMV